jgi:ATP-dependent RNA helicase RhlE
MKFDEYRLSPEIKRNLEAMGLKKPTDIQYRSIPHILQGEDVLAIAQTGTGKTAAFVIPLLHRIQSAKHSKGSAHLRCVVMVPTRELALQITGVFDQIGQKTKVKTLPLFGGVDQDPQIAQLINGVDILVTTPGRMFDLVSQGHIHLDRVEMLVLDEADHMLDLGFIKDIRDLIRYLPRQRQTLFFSATINEHIKKLAYSLVNNPIRIQVSPKDPVAKNITHSVAFIEMDDKRFFLARLIEEHPDQKILVFVRTKVRAERVHQALVRANVESLTLHGDKVQGERLEVLSQFREGKVRILIATDVSARGIDIPNVDYVVNYDLPDVAENYVHRVGRTGRGTQKGRAVSFCSTEEREVLRDIESYLSKPVAVLDISNSSYKETIALNNDRPDRWKEIMAEIEIAAAYERKKQKKRKA